MKPEVMLVDCGKEDERREMEESMEERMGWRSRRACGLC
jgi:hypothetical protein